jgi:NADH-quinone oxidoreductase subunit N
MPLFEIFDLRKAIIPMTIIGLLAILGLDISEFNSRRLLQQYDYCQ